MGLDQAILRNKDGRLPDIDDNGDFVNAKELIALRKENWLHNRLIEIGKQKLGKTYDELNCMYIPVTREELYEILEDSKRCVKEKDEFLVQDLFDVGMFYSNHDFDWCMEGMTHFNRVMGNCLRNEKETEYFYWSWW